MKDVHGKKNITGTSHIWGRIKLRLKTPGYFLSIILHISSDDLKLHWTTFLKYHLRVIIVRHLRVQNGKIIESEHQPVRDEGSGEEVRR